MQTGCRRGSGTWCYTRFAQRFAPSACRPRHCQDLAPPAHSRSRRRTQSWWGAPVRYQTVFFPSYLSFSFRLSHSPNHNVSRHDVHQGGCPQGSMPGAHSLNEAITCSVCISVMRFMCSAWPQLSSPCHTRLGLAYGRAAAAQRPRTRPQSSTETFICRSCGVSSARVRFVRTAGSLYPELSPTRVRRSTTHCKAC